MSQADFFQHTPPFRLPNLYPDQSRAVDALRANIKKEVWAQCLSAPTGSGKTILAAFMMGSALSIHRRALFVVDRIALGDQTSSVLTDYGIEHGILGGDRTRDRGADLVVASAQSMEAREWWPEDFHAVFIDEAHCQRQKVIKWIHRLKELKIPVIGLTATPFATGMGLVYDAVVQESTTNILIGEKRLAPLKIYIARSLVDMSGAPLSAGEWTGLGVEERSASVYGDIVPEWVEKTNREFGGPVKTLVFSATVAHGDEICRVFQTAGHEFHQVSYRDGNDDKRANIIERFRRGEIMGLVSCEALVRGFDVPDAQCLICARPLRKSLSTHIQMIGRLMRSSPGKKFGLLIDFTYNWSNFEEETREFFERGCHELNDERYKPAAKPPTKERGDMCCLACGFAMPTGAEVCPSCGKQRPKRKCMVEVAPGRLVEARGVDGTYPDFKGTDRDLWKMVCKIAVERHPLDTKRALAFARANYNSLRGKWSFWPLEVVQGPVHSGVRYLVEQAFDAWKKKMRKKKRAAKAAKAAKGTA